MGTELNDVYWKDGVNYMRAIEEEVSHPTLFDDLDEATA